MEVWVRRLGERLMSNGISIVLDQWDVGLGADLGHFMESGLTGADRVIAVCSDAYVKKANQGKRGVGYEKKIMTADLLKDALSSHVIPVLRDVTVDPPVPTFLSGTRYVDFRSDADWDERYRELVFDLYGLRIHQPPALGPNPFAAASVVATQQAVNFDPTKFYSTALQGKVTFPCEDNNGKFVIGSGTDAFTLALSTAGPGSLHVYNDPTDIATVALAVTTPLEKVLSPEAYDSSSRARTARVGDSVVLVSVLGRVAAFEVLAVTTRDTDPSGRGSATIRYAIRPSV